ncbi:MAG: metallophosphoesterase [Pirellulaceae bacterium]
MPKLLHVSDLHFGTPYLPRVGEALQRIAAELPIDGVVVSGDLTQRAKAEQFEAAPEVHRSTSGCAEVDHSGQPRRGALPTVERLSKPYELYRRFIDDRLDQVLDLPGMRLVGLNSTSPRRAISNGRIHLEQLEFCKRAFTDAPNGTRIVVAHHHARAGPRFSPRRNHAQGETGDGGVRGAGRRDDSRRSFTSGIHWELSRLLSGRETEPRNHDRPMRHEHQSAGTWSGKGKELLQRH